MIRTVRSGRLVLRELDVADCSEEYLGWLADAEVSRFLETRYSSHNAASVTGFIAAARARNDEYLFGIFLAADGRHIGNIKVGPIHPRHRLADVSLLIGARDCWGKGYATEAILAVSRYAFEELGVAKLSASMYAPNAGSRRAFLNAGYREEGLRRGHYDLASERCDLVEFGLLPADLVAAP